MSAAPSPMGSPTAATGDGMTSEQIALRMIQATESAAAAANAASLAVNAFTGGSSSSTQQGSESRVEWYKVLPKPQGFEPKTESKSLVASGIGS